MCDKVLDTFLFVFNFVPDQYKTQEICDKVISQEPFILKQCLDKCKFQEVHDKAVDAFWTMLLIVNVTDCYIVFFFYFMDLKTIELNNIALMMIILVKMILLI